MSRRLAVNMSATTAGVLLALGAFIKIADAAAKALMS